MSTNERNESPPSHCGVKPNTVIDTALNCLPAYHNSTAPGEMSSSSTEVVVDLDEWAVDFTELPPQRLMCSQCRRVFRNPQCFSCCNKSFCLACVEKIKKNESSQCPECQASDFRISPDGAKQQMINDLYVRCLHVSEGCMWFGKLEILPRHIDFQMKESQGGCIFVTVPCPNKCGGKYTKKTLQEHLLARCTKRKYNCEFCGGQSGIYETVESEHFPVCPKYPIWCPNKCPQRTVARSKLEFHLKNECEHQDNAPCVMEYAGCREKLLRKNMHSHLQKNLAEHMVLLGNLFVEHSKSMDEKLSSFQVSAPVVVSQEITSDKEAVNIEILQAKDAEIKKMKMDIDHIQREKDKQLNSMQAVIDGLRRTLELQEQRLAAIEAQNQNFTREVSRLRLFLPSPIPLNFTISKFEQFRQSGKWWYSRPFYSHYCGYKLGMFVFCNGVLDGKGTHLSVFLYLVRGEYDDELEWPFRGSITVQVLNQRSDRGHHQKVIKFTDDTPATVSSRVVNGEMAKEGNGPTQFIPHADLSYNAEKDTEYVRDDCLKVRISSIIIRGQSAPSRTPGGTGTLPRKISSQAERSPMLKGYSTDSAVTEEAISPRVLSPRLPFSSNGNATMPSDASPGTTPNILNGDDNGNGKEAIIKEMNDSRKENGEDFISKENGEASIPKKNDKEEKTVTIDL